VQAHSSNGSSSWGQTMASCNPALCIPISVLTDSYKASHFLQYPTSKKMVAVSTQQMQPGSSSTVQLFCWVARPLCWQVTAHVNLAVSCNPAWAPMQTLDALGSMQGVAPMQQLLPWLRQHLSLHRHHIAGRTTR
jgi:hypothetical protein